MRKLITLPKRNSRCPWLALWLVLLLLIGSGLAPVAAAQTGDPPHLTVLVGALNVRNGPGVTYPVTARLVQGDAVTVVGHHPANGWWQVELPDGYLGWVSGVSTYVQVRGDTANLPEGVTPGTCAAPTVSSDTDNTGLTGTLVFQTVSGGPIYAINAGDSNLRYLTTGMDPVLSPDGQWVAFTRWENPQSGALGSLWVINVDGSGERVIMSDIHQPKSPAWSPDGTRLAVNMQYGGWLDPRRMCSREKPPREVLEKPDEYDLETIDQKGEGKISCYTLPPDPYWGLRVVDVLTGTFEDMPAASHTRNPAWDPANNWRVIYAGDLGLGALDVTRGTTWALTDDVLDHGPVFSPDGRKIALSYWQHDHWEIHVLNADGSGRVRLTETPWRVIGEQRLNGEEPRLWNNAAPAWSPDGSQIAFLTDRTGRWEVWVMDVNGSNQRLMFPAGTLDQLELQYHSVDERVLSWQG